jgi:hypothetical protein
MADKIVGAFELAEILKHPVAIEILKDHAMTSRNGEQLAFYSDLITFKSVTNL